MLEVPFIVLHLLVEVVPICVTVRFLQSALFAPLFACNLPTLLPHQRVLDLHSARDEVIHVLIIEHVVVDFHV